MKKLSLILCFAILGIAAAISGCATTSPEWEPSQYELDQVANDVDGMAECAGFIQAVVDSDQDSSEEDVAEAIRYSEILKESATYASDTLFARSPLETQQAIEAGLSRGRDTFAGLDTDKPEQEDLAVKTIADCLTGYLAYVHSLMEEERVTDGTKSGDGGINFYMAEQCIGAVVNGVCHGSLTGRPIGTCYGTMLHGQCIGASLSNSGRDNLSPRTHSEMMRQSRPPTHDDMMCDANPFACKSTPNRREPRTHKEMMCASNPFHCD